VVVPTTGQTCWAVAMARVFGGMGGGGCVLVQSGVLITGESMCCQSNRAEEAERKGEHRKTKGDRRYPGESGHSTFGHEPCLSTFQPSSRREAR